MIVGHIGGSSAIYTGDIGHSLRFRASNNNYLSRVFSTPTDRNKFSVFVAIKRGTLGIAQTLFAAGSDDNNKTLIRFNASDQLEFLSIAGSVGQGNLTTSAVFRDSTAWLYFLFVFDFANSTASDRVRIYYYGDRLAVSTSASVTGANNHYLNAGTVEHRFSRSFATVQQADQYLARISWVDGQAHTPDFFAYLNTESNAWVTKSQAAVKAVVDAGGTNSFMLDFDDGTSLTTLGYDKSSKGNNWTANNISLTAGSSYDWMDDTPTNNFPTWNPLDNLYSSNTTSNGNLTLTSPVGANYAPGKASMQAVGKCYWEIVTGSQSGISAYALGVIDNVTVNDYFVNQPTAGKAYYYGNNGAIVVGSTTVATGATFTDNDVIGFAFDQSAGTLAFYKNNVLQGTATSLSGYTLFPAAGDQTSTGGGYTANINFGQRPFTYSPPAGFKALCTKNLPLPSILNPNKHFDVKTYTGNGSTQNVTGVGFTPDLAWIKSRSNVTENSLFDSVRGPGKLLIPNSTTNEVGNVGDLLTSFNVAGITVNVTFLGAANATTNGNGYTYVTWLWKAGGAQVTNNSGSIQSQVSANPAAGFSIVTYTGTGANATIGHGLGVAPKLVLVKSRDRSDQPWLVWHSALLGSEYLLLNSTNAKATSAAPWNNTVPTSQVFSVGVSASSNELNKNFVAYCFAEIPGYSKIGSYTGNGSADGPFVYCGFRPRYVLIKRIDAGPSNWTIHDTAREASNVQQAVLYPNLSNAEASKSAIDVLSNGFKVRHSTSEQNGSGGSYIFYAVAEQQFQFANAR